MSSTLSGRVRNQRLVRTSSIEKIKRFNNYICTQQFYVLPALLTWLKTSQSSFQAALQYVHNCLLNLIYILMKLTETRLFLGVCVFLTASILSLQIGFFVYLLCDVVLPGGLIFLLVSGGYISVLYYRIIFHDLVCGKCKHISRSRKNK